jgi:putative colanic acid biosynthesis glycosyltransferase
MKKTKCTCDGHSELAAARSIRNPHFSIITVVYNDITGLALTKASVFLQTFPDFEWIVIDGGSSDGTSSYLSSLQSPFLKWISESDRGIYDAMNKGILLAQGEYLVFLNAGDIFPSLNTLALVSDEIDKHGKPDVLFGGAALVFANGKSIVRSPRKIESYIWHGLPANHQGTYYKRNALGDLLYDPTYKICGDYYIIAKLYLKNISVAYLNQALVKFSVGGASYQNRVPLFLEPYKIQRDILKKSLPLRCVSLAKRLVATAMMILLQKLSQIRR